MAGVTVPLDQIGPGIHCFGHIGVTDRGKEVLQEALSELALNGSDPQFRADANELLVQLLDVEAVT